MQSTGRIALDPRLSMIASLVGRCRCCADIGCDHGRLGAFLLQSGQCEHMQLTDISEPSLKKARMLLYGLGLSDRADFCVGDGAQALSAPADVAVVAGMGGVTIADILREGRQKLGEARLVLQPNVAAPQLRGELSRLGYRITDERVAQDGRRNYVVIAAVPGRSDYGLKARVVGPVLLERMPEELEPYARFRLRVAKKALEGAATARDGSQTAPLEQEIEIWEEVCECLQRRNRC